jgi:hypothetical protein
MLMGAGICADAMAEAGVSTSLELGYRVDSLDWNIAGDSNGQNPNILSELSWSNLVIPQARLKLDGESNGAHLFGTLAYGKVSSGDNQDSDYYDDNRQGEFSRSNNQADGDVADGSIGIGYRLAANANLDRNGYVMPMAGYSLHRQNLKMTDGYQTISTVGETPPLGPIPGLNSSYDAQWRGGWLGVSFIEEDPESGFRFGFDVAYHWIQYYAEADWNLRPDFAHPKSFEHRANGGGWTFSMNAASRLAKNLDWLLGLDYGSWQTHRGVDTVYSSNGDGAQTRLNEVNWESLAINLGLVLRL